MKTRKRIGIFLLLGVMLVGLLTSGCTPVEQTQGSTSEPDPNAIAFLDLPGVNMDDICEINIYTGDDRNYPVYTLDDPQDILNFLAAYETLRFHWIDTDVPPTSSERLANFTEEYWTALEETLRAYRIEVQLTDDPQRILTGWNFYVGTNGTVYYLDAQLNIYVSTAETDYIDVLGIGPVLNRSYIEGCTYAGVTKSLNDSATHTLFGEENVIAFFDTFFAGLVLTDNGARIKQVQANYDQSGFPFQICFTCNENTSLLVCFYENGAITVNYENHDFASVQDNVVDKQAIEQWLKEHDAL